MARPAPRWRDISKPDTRSGRKAPKPLPPPSGNPETRAKPGWIERASNWLYRKGHTT